MRRYQNLIIIGTSHIAIESIADVKSSILKSRPDIVALELDSLRLNAMLSGRKRKLSVRDILKLGVKAYLFSIIGAWIEERLGKLVGTKPGDEMKIAIETAREINAKIALIDQNINVTLAKLSKSITSKEKLRFLLEIIKAIFIRKPVIQFDLRKVPSRELIKTLVKKLEKDYPSVYRILITERNAYMSKSLYKLMLLNKTIIAVVGAGHEDGLIEQIKCLQQKNQSIS